MTSGQNQIPALFTEPSHLLGTGSLLGIPAATQRSSICHRAGSRLLRRPHVLRREELQGGPRPAFSRQKIGVEAKAFSKNSLGAPWAVWLQKTHPRAWARGTWKNPVARRMSANLQGRGTSRKSTARTQSGPALSGSQLKGICSSCHKLFYPV